MATFCFNGEFILEVSQAQIGQLPEQFGIFDLEQILKGPLAEDKRILKGIKELSIDGIFLDKKRLKGYTWEELCTNQDPVIGVLAEFEEVEGSEVESKGGETTKKGGKKRVSKHQPSDKSKNRTSDEVARLYQSLNLT